MRVTGTITEQESGKPLAGLRVRAYDKDLVFDDDLGEATTDAAGYFEISYMENQFRDLEEKEPDIYLRVYDAGGSRLLYSSEKAVRRNAQLVERFEIQIPHDKLAG